LGGRHHVGRKTGGGIKQGDVGLPGGLMEFRYPVLCVFGGPVIITATFNRRPRHEVTL
jgi:hypothetical protein